MLKTLFFNRPLMAITLLCVCAPGCRQERKVEVAPVSIELTAMDQLPDSESMSALRDTVAEVVRAFRSGQHRSVYELLAPEIRRAVPFSEFLQRFGVKRNQALSLWENLPEPDFSRVRDRVAEIFIMQPGDRTRTAIHLDLLQVDHRWFLRTVVVYDRPFHMFHYSGGLISPGSTQQDLISIKEAMLQKALVTGKDWPDADGFPDIGLLKPSVPVFVARDLDLRIDAPIHVPGRTIQVVSESTAIARRGTMFFKFDSIQIFGDLVLGRLTLSHPDFSEGGGGAQMWLVRRGSLWRFYMYGVQEIS
jgi:hypothetical protein